MSDKGAAMQKYINETVQCIENFKMQRNKLDKAIAEDEVKKAQLEDHMKLLQFELNQVNENLKHNSEQRTRYEQTIQDAEKSYMKILDSCQTLTCFLMKEAESLCQESDQKMKPHQ